MKKGAKLLVTGLATVTLLGSSILGGSRSMAKDVTYGNSISMFTFNPSELLNLYAVSSATENPDLWAHLANVQEGKEIPIYLYDDGVKREGDNTWMDDRIDARDTSKMCGLAGAFLPYDELDDEDKAEYESKEKYIEYRQNLWNGNAADDIANSLADYLKISANDVKVTVDVTMPAIAEFGIEETKYTIDNKTKTVASQYDAITKLASNNAKAQVKAKENGYDNAKNHNFYYVSATASTNDGQEYKMVVVYAEGKNAENMGTKEEKYNFCLARPQDIGDDEPTGEFDTKLDYESEVKGKMDKDTYLALYYENEDKDAKKDLDVTAIITSITEEIIVKTNDVELTDSNIKNNPNSEGWYYLDINNKKVIAKDYAFDKYNNPKDNGAVRETVKLTGVDGGEDTQEPSIRWTLRRINYEQKKNDDGSITVTITYNLPIDEKSIPEGWEAIVDKDGGIRKITRTFKEKDGDYTKDVTVKRNGPIDEKVTTAVEVKWDNTKAKDVIPQTGIFTAAGVAVAGGVTAFSINRYRKVKKSKNK